MNNHGWMVRAGNDNELITEFQTNSLVAIGWADLGDVSEFTTREGLRSHFASIDEYSDYKQGRITTNASQVYRFAHEINDGDLVFTYNKNEREYHVGTIEGKYEFQPDNAPSEYPHVRQVNWEQTIPRDEFSTSVKNTLGAALTVFSLDDQLDEIQDVLSDGPSPSTGEEDKDTPTFAENTESQADELIADIIANMDPYDFEGLTAAVLRAMGYDAQKTPDSHDRGVDVIAHPDSLGFETPFIKSQVKRTKGSVGSPDMQAFLGALSGTDKGLYVSLGGYTTGAEQAAQSADERIKLLDRDGFIDLLLQHYEDLDSEYQAKVPLKRIYIPTQDPPIEE
jgi:restriction system protein